MSGADARFDGRLVLVAGGTGALGRALSLAFLEAGAHVAVTYRRRVEFDALAEGAPAHADRLEGHASDATDETATHRLVDDLLARHARLDVLVNAVGGYAGGRPLWELESAEFDRLLALNLRSGYALARAGVPTMLQRGRGAIVNIAARAGVQPSAGAAVYSASKAAALALMDALAAEVAGSGVRVNSVLPSLIDTEANRRAMPSADHSKWPKPEDIARVVLFLCSDDARLIHGASVPVYGSG